MNLFFGTGGCGLLLLMLDKLAAKTVLLNILQTAQGTIEHDVRFANGSEDLIVGALRLLDPHQDFVAIMQLLARDTGSDGLTEALEVEE